MTSSPLRLKDPKWGHLAYFVATGLAVMGFFWLGMLVYRRISNGESVSLLSGFSGQPTATPLLAKAPGTLSKPSFEAFTIAGDDPVKILGHSSDTRGRDVIIGVTQPTVIFDKINPNNGLLLTPTNSPFHLGVIPSNSSLWAVRQSSTTVVTVVSKLVT